MRRALILPVCVILVLLFRFYIFFGSQNTQKAGDMFDQKILLLSEPKISGRFQIFRYGPVIIQTPRYPQFHYGDVVRVSGKIKAETISSNSGKKTEILMVSFPKVHLLQNPNPIIQSTAFLRKKISDTFFKTLPRNEAALLFGIVFGGSSSFDPVYYQAFRNTGVLHVIAASGMNVTMVAGFLILLLSKFMRRQWALGTGIAGIFYYALISGFQPSILRAGIMASIAFTAGILGRQNFGLYSLFITAGIMLFIKPDTLFDVGFLLSFSSTIGIMLIKPIFDSIQLVKKTQAVSDDITTTVSAQIGSLPVMVSAFSAYSVVSVFVNALVLWTVPVLMILGGIASMCAIFLPFLSFIFLYLCYPFLLYFEKIVVIFNVIPILQISNIPLVLWAGYYMLIFSILLHLRQHKKK